jgi:hypothetical protein
MLSSLYFFPQYRENPTLTEGRRKLAFFVAPLQHQTFSASAYLPYLSPCSPEWLAPSGGV